ncbi:MAG: adenylate kinase [Candidatus Bipolaricaulota bacterium]|nr:MAG: adenylate kinase [Candidatus Bipolaricaulota bacterium]
MARGDRYRRAASSLPGRRINVIGVCGSGKTTVGRILAARLGLPFVELDALAWGPEWTLSSDEDLRRRVDEGTRGDAWVLDGNYSRFRDLVWPRADTIVWLDYSFPRAFSQLLWRTLRRCATREELWSGNRERPMNALFSRDSILWWGIKTFRRRRRNDPAQLARVEHRHLCTVHLRTRRQTRAWLECLPAPVRQPKEEP